jgi:GTPase SAR1 family protein
MGHSPLGAGNIIRSILPEAKLLLVGEGAVGKTSLLTALKGEPFCKNRMTTHGVEIERVHIPHPDGKHEIAFNAWDFGGQEVYRGTNQFFYSPHAVYLLLWDARAGMTRCDVLGWLERIKLRVGSKARVIIVATYYVTDQHYPFLNLAEIREKFGDIIAGVAEVDSGVLADGKTPADDGDAREKYGMAALRQQIAGVAAGLPHMGQERFNAQWRAARDEVLALRE